MASPPERAPAVPAGFGKTTLVAQWRSSPAESRPFAWISLDHSDSHPGGLWRHITTAAQRTCPGLSSDEILTALGARNPDFAGTLLPLLLNELSMLPEPIVIALDDYHVVKDSSCHTQIASLLLHLSPAVQLVLITWVAALPLARMRAVGEMIEVRARELRFGPGHAATSWTLSLESDLSSFGWPQVAAFGTRTAKVRMP